MVVSGGPTALLLIVYLLRMAGELAFKHVGTLYKQQTNVMSVRRIGMSVPFLYCPLELNVARNSALQSRWPAKDA